MGINFATILSVSVTSIKITTFNQQLENGINDTANTTGSTNKQTGRRLKRIAVVVFKTCWLNSFSKFLFVFCSDCYNAWGPILVDKKLLFCHSQVIIIITTNNYYYYRSFVSLLLLLLLGAS